MSTWDKPAPDAVKLLSTWAEWEQGETAPGQVLSNLKRGGLAELLEQLAAAESSAPAGA